MKVGLMSMATGAALVIIVATITAMHSEEAFAQNESTTIISEPVKVQILQKDLKNLQTDFKNVQTDFKNLQTDMTSPGKVGPAPTISTGTAQPTATVSRQAITAAGASRLGGEAIPQYQPNNHLKKEVVPIGRVDIKAAFAKSCSQVPAELAKLPEIQYYCMQYAKPPNIAAK